MKRFIYLTIFLLTLGTLWAVKLTYPEKEVPEVKTTQVSVEAPEPVATVQDVYTPLDYQLLDLTNKDRAANGLPALTMAQDLDTSAMNKCQDMLAKGYWAHNPPGGSWVTFLPTRYFHKGENLARGFQSPASAEDAWMHSPTHRANILNTYTYVGFAECGNLYVAHFGQN